MNTTCPYESCTRESCACRDEEILRLQALIAAESDSHNELQIKLQEAMEEIERLNARVKELEKAIVIYVKQERGNYRAQGPVSYSPGNKAAKV